MHKSLLPESPRAEFRVNSRKRITNQLQASAAAKRQRQVGKANRRNRWFLRPAYALASLTLVLAMLASGIGVVNASASSLPGDTLYGVKLARERISLTLSLSAEGDHKLLTEFAEERLEEAEALIEQNRLDDLPAALEGFENRLDELERLTDANDEIQPGALEHLKARLDNHIQVLQRVMENTPEPAREALQNALEKSSHGREVLENLRGEGHPSENAPGQNKPEKDNDSEGVHPGNSGQRGRPDEGEKGPPNNPGQGQKGPPDNPGIGSNGPPPWANNK
jgi:hypothetical protein